MPSPMVKPAWMFAQSAKSSGSPSSTRVEPSRQRISAWRTRAVNRRLTTCPRTPRSWAATRVPSSIPRAIHGPEGRRAGGIDRTARRSAVDATMPMRSEARPAPPTATMRVSPTSYSHCWPTQGLAAWRKLKGSAEGMPLTMMWRPMARCHHTSLSRKGCTVSTRLSVHAPSSHA